MEGHGRRAFFCGKVFILLLRICLSLQHVIRSRRNKWCEPIALLQNHRLGLM
jgi:hypothetical protein